MTAPVDWGRWRQCPVCSAAIGEPCMDITGRYMQDGQLMAIEKQVDRPHGGRRPRSGGAR
jgi:hypothetical protein